MNTLPGATRDIARRHSSMRWRSRDANARDATRALSLAQSRVAFARDALRDALITFDVARVCVDGRANNGALERRALTSARMRIRELNEAIETNHVANDRLTLANDTRERALIDSKRALANAKETFETAVANEASERDAREALARVERARRNAMGEKMSRLLALIPCDDDDDDDEDEDVLVNERYGGRRRTTTTRTERTTERTTRTSEAPRAVRCAGARVPDAKDRAGFDAKELAAGLGALAQFLTLASRYLDAPRLHRASNAGSTSYVWVPLDAWDDVERSAWENRGTVHVRDVPQDGCERLPLFIPRALAESAGDRGQVAIRESRAKLKAAMRLLSRSCAALCAHEAAALGVVAPDGFGPFAQLCAIASEAARGDARLDASSDDLSRVPAKRFAGALRNSTNATVEVDGTRASSAIDDDARSNVAKTWRIPALNLSQRSRDRRKETMEPDEDDFGHVDGAFFDGEAFRDRGVDSWHRVNQSSHKPSPAKVASSPSSLPRPLILPPPPSEIDDTAQWIAAHKLDVGRR